MTGLREVTVLSHFCPEAVGHRIEKRTLGKSQVFMPQAQSAQHRQYFFDKFGITDRLLERCLGEALAAGGDYADLYFESVTAIS